MPSIFWFRFILLPETEVKVYFTVSGEPSRTIFQKYGNFSAPSVVFVLEQWLRDGKRAEKDEKTRGCAISFGAGYFVAGMTYHWSKR